MAILNHGLVQRSLEEVFGWLERRDLALPELQRPSVWGENKIPRLLSSVYNDYPFGIFLIWSPKTEERIRCRAFAFGHLAPEDPDRRPSHYLIDGQQRLTSFYRTLHGEGNVEVVFNVRCEDFQLKNAKFSEKDGWFSLRHLLTMNDRERVQFKDRHAHLGDDAFFDRVFRRLGHLRPENIELTFFNVQERPYREVAEIFERINLGTPVKSSQIALGKLSATLPGIVQKVETYLAEMKLQHGNEFDLDLFMNVLAVTATQHIDLDHLLERYQVNDQGANGRRGTSDNEKVLSQDLDVAKKAFERAFSFADRHLHIDTMRYFPSERTLTILAFLCSKHPHYLDDETNAWRIALWIARALLVRRHSDQREMRHDVRIIRENSKEIAEALLGPIREAEVKQRILHLKDMESSISWNNELFGFLYALIRWKEAVSWIRRDFSIATHPDPEKQLDVHHIYPAAQIERELTDDGRKWKEEWRDDIGNLTFLLWKDNEALKDPNITYLLDYPEVLPPHLVPADKRYKAGEYGRFLRDRRIIISSALMDFMSYLQQKAQLEHAMED
jgi:hypothetical protein